MVRRSVSVFASVVLALAGASCAGSSDKGGGGTVKMVTVKMVLWPGPEGDAMQKVVAAYNANQGKQNGIKVDMILLSRDDTFAVEGTQIGTRSSNMDMYFTASYNVGFLRAGLDPLDDLKLDDSKYFKSAIDGLKVDGKLYAVPLDVSNHFLYYRKDLIDRLSQDAQWKSRFAEVSKKAVGQALQPKAPDQWTLEDYVATAAFFSKTANPDSPTTYGTALQLKTSPFNITLWDDLVWGSGGGWVNASGKADLNSEPALKTTEAYAQIYKSGYTSKDSAQAEYPETNAALQSGQVAFALQWSSAFGELTDATKSPKIAKLIAVAPPPGGKTHVHALAVSLNKYSKNKAAARTWLKYLATPEAMDAYAKAGGIPSMPAVLEANTSVNPGFTAIASTVQSSGYSPPIWAGTFATMTALVEDLNPAWVGIETPAAAHAKANGDLMQELLKK